MTNRDLGRAFDTASVHLSLLGLCYRALGKRKTAGLLLLSVGVGYLGVIHERISGTRLSGYRHGHWDQLHLRQLAWHVLAGAIGLRWITHTVRSQ